ncbi:unnamed protein product [Euphydryas editha]|uniref:C2H2-type domain-containing protein n=1 Tax=Euphydryas editha TaxID=104508 RepID=A0AAU9UYV2_EUPED|nr:unnamed protein product [Euphydryas editha]
MNTFMQNRYNKRYKQTMSWNENVLPQGHNIKKNYYSHSPWSSQVSPGSENYWCETCDKGFINKTLLENHKLHHQKCNIDGCQFVAHPKVITKHIQMQHATGLYKRIGKLDNPEEIKKWREERKKKYPTKENIEKKQAETKEKIKRGEKMGLKHDKHRKNTDKPGFHNKRQKARIHEKHNKAFNNKKINSPLSNNKKPVKNTIHQIVPPKEEHRKLQPFKGIQNLVIDNQIDNNSPEECHDLIEDDYETDIKEEEIVSKPTVCGALTSLICNYESTDEEDNEENTKQATVKSSKILMPENQKINFDINNDVNVSVKCEKFNNNTEVSKAENNSICNNESENESGPEEKTITKSEPILNNDSKPIKCFQSRKERLQRQDRLKNRHKQFTRNLKRKLPSTLLEKLLHKEIQHERNVILQCIRYVVKNNYFDKK